MTTQSSWVQIAPNSTGAKVDTVEITQDGGAIVQRQAVTIGDATGQDNFLTVESNGAALVRPDGTRQPVSVAATVAQLVSAPFDFGGGSGTLVPLAAGFKTRVYRLILVASAATNIQFLDNITPLSGNMALGANEAITLDFDGEPWFTGSTGLDFKLLSSNAVQIGGTVYYVQS